MLKIYLKQIRHQKNLSLLQLSHKSGVSTTELNDIENQRKTPRLDTICRIAVALDVNINNELYEYIK